MALSIVQIDVGGFDDNFSYLLYSTETNEAAYIDPTGDTSLVLEAAKNLGLTITEIWITHTHFDHIDQLAAVLGHTNALVRVHALGAGRLTGAAPETFRDGDVLTLGRSAVTVLHTPGHLDDSVCFYSEDTGGVPICITGDTLFVEGCGRTDQANAPDLYHSLERLKALPPETIVYPGHDYGSTPTSTIGHELQTNKYLLAEDLEEFLTLRLG